MTPRTTTEQLWSLAAGAGLLGAIALGDWATGPVLSFSSFYLLPVSLVAWRVGRWPALCFCVLAPLSWLMADYVLEGEALSWAIGWNAVVRGIFYIVITFLVVALRQRLEHEERLADTDGLTGLLNSRAFIERVTSEFERARRYAHPCTLAYLDLDNFKAINDRFGHAQGDLLLREIATLLTRHSRASDLVARLGGDEFVLLLPETSLEPARAMLDKLRRQLAEQMLRDGWHVTISVGAVCTEDAQATAQELIAAADRLMYAVKHGGKDVVTVERFASTSGAALAPRAG